MDNFSNLMMIGECLLDRKRTHLFRKAIQKIVKRGDVVLDAGTGSGIMAMLAAKSGAAKVYAVELEPSISNIAQSNIAKNGLDSVIEVVNDDMKQVQIPKVDVLIMEMMDTGLVAEQQVVAVNNLHDSGTIDKNTKIIPSIFETYIQFINYDFNFYDLEMPFIVQARNFGVLRRIKRKFSNPILIRKIDFSEKNELEVLYKGELVAAKSGIINSIIMTSKIFLCDDVHTWGTTDMNMPVIIPVEERKINKGDVLNFTIGYTMSHGFGTINFLWTQLN